ncbi:MAG: translation initiation factor IF-2 N-terminal domain-containing protein, partial [Oligoflexales bacterium]|nr:translation initiation factor IF-2 N-terminal domain-containing protein [Oligoflexales bacterium]
MSKVRVYELARELNLESKLLISRLKGLGISVASHQSTLSDDEVLKARKIFKGESQEDMASKSASPIVVIRRRRTVTESATVKPGESTGLRSGDSEDEAIAHGEKSPEEHKVKKEITGDQDEIQGREHDLKSEITSHDASGAEHSDLDLIKGQSEQSTFSSVLNRESREDSFKSEKEKKGDEYSKIADSEPREETELKTKIRVDVLKEKIADESDGLFEGHKKLRKEAFSKSDEDNEGSKKRTQLKPDISQIQEDHSFNKLKKDVPRSFIEKTGATIVRRATPEEVEARKFVSQNKQRDVKKSAGAPVVSQQYKDQKVYRGQTDDKDRSKSVEKSAFKPEDVLIEEPWKEDRFSKNVGGDKKK